MPCETPTQSTLSLRDTLVSLESSYSKRSHVRSTPPLPKFRLSPTPTSQVHILPIPPSKPKPRKKKGEKLAKDKSKSRRRKFRSCSVPNSYVIESVQDLKSSTSPKEISTTPKPTKTENVKLPNLSQSPKPPPIQKEGNSQQQEGKKAKKPALLNAIRPENMEAEKTKFLQSNFEYNPQLTYRNPPSESTLAKFSRPSSALVHVAEKILQNVIKRYNTYEYFEEKTAGKLLTRTQIVEAAKQYLKKEGMLEEVSVRLTDDILARACMSRIRGQPTLQVRTNIIRESWMDGILRHEIGTHYMRSSNNRLQTWSRWKKRRELDLGPINPTEEGLAALHSVIYRPQPSLFRSALLYYTVYQASRLSFSQLFQDLGRFVKDPETRWDFCMRAKRGQEDTEQPGSFCKDQVYLRGAMEILKHRHNIDFHALLQCGKVDYHDLDRLKEIADLENTRVPGFMADIELYRKKLGDILEWNGITDRDLQCV